ncbi:MAG: hypothetical protein E7537_01510 [Ruminococcaceae bacterium]|nr:hypothetical protein [Oscillospiraceae bacterium]
MRKVLKSVLFLILLCFIILNFLVVSAKKYQKDVVVCDFKNGESAFLIPGDYDGNGLIDESDINNLRALILSIKNNNYSGVFENDLNTIYSDSNGDAIIDIRDLVIQYENKDKNFIIDGSLMLNGNSAFSKELLSNLGTGAEYKIQYSYEDNGDIKVKLNGIDNLILDKTSTEKNDGLITVTREIKTPFIIEEVKGIELQLVGFGKVKEFSITRVNMDNELIDKSEW